jgi:hypothetical protein
MAPEVTMEDVAGTTNGTAHPTIERARARAREVQQGALHVLTDTPGWVWAVVGGVILLMIGILAASRYRMRPHEPHA